MLQNFCGGKSRFVQKIAIEKKNSDAWTCTKNQINAISQIELFIAIKMSIIVSVYGEISIFPDFL